MEIQQAATGNAPGDSFSVEQKEYLQGFFAGIANRGLIPFVGETASGLLTHDPASGLANRAALEVEEETFFGTPVSDLCREEQWKHASNPLDFWEQIVAHAAENRAPDAEGTYRFKYQGLFYVAPAQDAFMLRLRTPGCILRSAQLRGLAEMAEEWGGGECAITTRGNLQIREFAPKDVVRVLMKVQSLGLSSRGTGADNIRNVTATPTTGLDAAELYDVFGLAKALDFYISNSRDLYGLPRKFNVAFDSGGAVSVVADTNDIGFIATRVAEGRSVPAGIYFRVLLCGITGHKQFASDTGLLLTPDQVVATAVAMIRVFNDHGDRTDRKKARLKYLVDRWGMAKFLDETEKRLAFPLLRVAEAECEPRGPIDRHGHLGVHAQREPGLCYLGVGVPVGKMSAAQMRAVAEIAEKYGRGEVRLTVWQNFLLPHVAAENVEAATAALAAAGLTISPNTMAAGAVACTGNQGCRFSATDTKRHAVELAAYLDERFKIDRPVNLHVTGCNHSCAQHYIGDIGLMGVKVGGEEGYQVVVGGGSDHDQAIGRELIAAVKFSELPERMNALFGAFTARRNEGESFLEFTRRHEIDELKSFCGGQP
jgi:ferredoxin-nitrite reductase